MANLSERREGCLSQERIIELDRAITTAPRYQSGLKKGDIIDPFPGATPEEESHLHNCDICLEAWLSGKFDE